MIANIRGMPAIRQKAHPHKKISYYIDELPNLATNMKAESGTSR
jgi:hypothetical protein